jgi:hypothetical protein
MKRADRDHSAKFVSIRVLASSELRVVRAYLYEVSPGDVPIIVEIEEAALLASSL